MLRKRFAMEVAGEVPVAILFSCSAERSPQTSLLLFSTILRAETIAFSSDLWIFRSCSSQLAMREIHKLVGMLG